MLRDEYPRKIDEQPDIEGVEEEAIYANLSYLEGHGLCESGLVQSADGVFGWAGASITASGIDFLEEDGGLSAILGVVTIKLHADTLRELLSAKIESAPIPPEEKSRLKKLLATLSETALKAGATEMVVTGLKHVQDIAQWIPKLAAP